MAIDVATQRRELHGIIDRLPDTRLAAAHDLLEAVVPLSQYLASLPFDDEGQLTDETIAGIQEAEASLARGEYVTHEEMLREFGP